MPVTPVKSPSGEIVKVQHPEGATQEQIIAYAKQQAKPVRPPMAQRGSYYEPPSKREAMGRGAQNIIDRAVQLGVAGGEFFRVPGYYKGISDDVTKNINKEQAAYKEFSAGAPRPYSEAIGGVGMTAPLALIPGGTSFGTRAASGAGVGALSGALQYDPTNSLAGTGKNVALGAAIGAVATPVVGAATDKLALGAQWLTGQIRGALANKTAGRIVNEIPDIASLPPAAQQTLIAEAQAMIAKTGTLNAEQLARKANLIAQGVTPTKSMVTRNPADWTLERNLQKLSQSPDEAISATGQKLTDVYQANDKALSAVLAKIQSGLPKGSAEEQGMVVMKSVDDLAKASDKAASKIYTMVREKYGDELASDARSLFSVIDDLKDSPAADPVTQAAIRRLTKWGMIDKDGNLTSKTLTVKEAEGLRQFINQQPNVFGKQQIIKAIDADVLSGAGQDVFSGARQAWATSKELVNNPASQKAINTLGELTQGKAAQGFIQSQIVTAPTQDIESLLATLAKSVEPEKAIAAIRSGLMQHLESKAINQNSGQFSGAGLNKAVNQLGPRLELVLGNDMAQQVRNLTRASLDATFTPPYSAVNNSNTAPMLMSLLEKGRAVAGVNLPFGLNDTAVKMAARSGYNSQLGDVLSAKAAPLAPKGVRTLDEVLASLTQAAPAVSVGMFNQYGREADERKKKRREK